MRAPNEGGLQVQFVEPAHVRQIGWAHRLGPVIQRSPTDVEQAGLTREAEFMVSVDHGFALSNPALVNALSKKSFSSASCPILACSGARFTGSGDASPANTLDGTLQQLLLPFADLVRMQFELCAQLSHGAIFPQGGQRHLRLGNRIVGAAHTPTRCLLLHQ